jgi:8-oxo-dGTP pyrophosphatase MutT (NUDIX family)
MWPFAKRPDSHFNGYISVAGIIASPDRKRFFIGERSLEDEFFPGVTAVPGGRLGTNESVLTCLEREAREEAGLAICSSTCLFLFDAQFKRDKHYVKQLILGTVSSFDGPYTKPVGNELANIRLVTPYEFRICVPLSTSSNPYQSALHTAVINAQNRGLLVL